MADTQSPNTLTMPGNKPAPVAKSEPEAERKILVELLYDVWIDDPGHPESVEGIRRLRTNIQELDEDGNPIIDKKSKNYVTHTVKEEITFSVAKKLIEAGKVRRADPL